MPPPIAPFDEMGLWGARRRVNLRCRRKSNWRDVCFDWARRLTDSMLWPVCGKQGRIQVFVDARPQWPCVVDIPNEGNEEWTVGEREMGGRSKEHCRRLPHIPARVVWCPGSTIIRSTRPTHPTILRPSRRGEISKRFISCAREIYDRRCIASKKPT